jgi:hypothetical protein
LLIFHVCSKLHRWIMTDWVRAGGEKKNYRGFLSDGWGRGKRAKEWPLFLQSYRQTRR